MKKNDILNLYIENTGFEGEGIARVDGLPIFIRNAAEGDWADVRIVKVNKNFAFGRVEKITTPSPFRCLPVCESFGKCGGCNMMHINYKKQLKVKKNIVINNLRKIAHLSEDDFEFEGIIGCDKQYNYRNKSQFPITSVNGEAVLGFYAPSSHRVVPCENCYIQNEHINRAAKAVLEYINENNISVYNESTGEGIIRHLYVRTSKCEDIMAVIVTNSEEEIPFKERLVEKLSASGNVKSIIQNINLRRDNIVLGYENITLYGDDRLTMELDDLKFRVSPNSFFQVNTEQAERLYSKALEYADLTGEENVFDLYCGVGSISLYLAKNAKTVYGVEIVKDAVINAEENAKINGISNAYFIHGDCTKAVDEIIGQENKADVVVVDPPRKGCDSELLSLINHISPKRIVYVSCNSSTLARDISYLAEYGYKLEKAVAVDMFPQTAHVECCAVMHRAQQ